MARRSIALAFRPPWPVLIAVAAEVGVDVESLREASRELRVRGAELVTALANHTKRDAWLRQQRLIFYRHAGIYAIVNVALFLLGLGLLSFTAWWIWFLPALAWGVGLAISRSGRVHLQ